MDLPLLATLSLGRDRGSSPAPGRSGATRSSATRGDPADSLHLVPCWPSGRARQPRLGCGGSLQHFGIRVTTSISSPLSGLAVDERPAWWRSRTAVCSLLPRPASTGSARPTRTWKACYRPLLAESVDRLSRRLLETMVVGLELRIYRRLIDLVASFRAPNNTATIPLCQASLADLVRATRLSSKQMLHRLVDQGQVRVRRGRIDVLDIDALSRRCGY